MTKKSAFTEISLEERHRRAQAIQSMAVLDTPPEAGFDALTRLASIVCQTPVAVVSLLDGERVWFKSVQGLDVTSIDTKRSFACEVANSKLLLEVADARLDLRFADHPLVAAESGMVYYAGAPILHDGVGIGSVCVLDYKVRKLTPESLKALEEMSIIALSMLRSRIEAFNFFSETRKS